MAEPQASPTFQKPAPREYVGCQDWIPIGAAVGAVIEKLHLKGGGK